VVKLNPACRKVENNLFLECGCVEVLQQRSLVCFGGLWKVDRATEISVPGGIMNE
jgi:hypothetical protein